MARVQSVPQTVPRPPEMWPRIRDGPGNLDLRIKHHRKYCRSCLYNAPNQSVFPHQLHIGGFGLRM
jgi:hypothetical protein